MITEVQEIALWKNAKQIGKEIDFQLKMWETKWWTIVSQLEDELRKMQEIEKKSLWEKLLKYLVKIGCNEKDIKERIFENIDFVYRCYWDASLKIQAEALISV